MEQHVDGDVKLRRYLTPLGAWALSFGCAVGWGGFVMPGTTFLPLAGPVGTLIGLGIGAAVMFIIGRNYHYLIQHFPEAGGAYGYVKRVCGYDHGYICGWFLILTYVAIAWANLTALALIGRKLLGGIFSFGFKYEVAGYNVYAGEILLCLGALLVVAAIFLAGKRFTARVQTFFALVLFVGIAICVTAAIGKHSGGIASLAPAFAEGKHSVLQIISIVVIAPWAFVGFESVSHSAEEFDFPSRRTVSIIITSLAAATAAYALLTFIAASIRYPGFDNWRDYIAARPSMTGIDAMPALYTIKNSLGSYGIAILCITTFAAIATGIVGCIVAASRLMYAMSHDGLLPQTFGELDNDHTPRKAIFFILAVSCLLPFVGRTALGWIVDIVTVAASIAYGYVSYCAFKVAKDEKRPWIMATGAAGFAIAIVFMVYFLVPNFWVVDVLATESYLILAAWSIIGVIVFRFFFNRDTTGRLGTSTVAWIALLFFILFSGHMWDREMTSSLTSEVVTEIHEHINGMDSPEHGEDCDFLERQKDWVDDTLTKYNLIQVGILVLTLAIMYGIYSVVAKRERHAAKAKAYFFSTISHDVRTPLNVIVGYSQMLQLGFKTDKERDDAVDSILVSSKALLGLVNDILDLSRTDIDRPEAANTATDCHIMMHEIVESFRAVAPSSRKVSIRDVIYEMPVLMMDHMRLRHVVFNLMSNAVKFTEKGYIELRAKFDIGETKTSGTLHIEVEDTGPGISAEDQKHIDSPYEQTDSKIARNGGTGFGLAIARRFVEAMGGRLTLKSFIGKGTTFYIDIPGVQIAPPATAHEINHEHVLSAETSVPRALLVDDSKMNLTVLKALMKRLGAYEFETAMDGNEAWERLQRTDLPPFDVVLTDMWMPEMDGEALAKAIRSEKRLENLPVFVITADVELEDNYAEKGFDDILLKPVTLNALKELLLTQGGGNAS